MAIQFADPIITDKVELALDLWLSEMSGVSDQTEQMAARMAHLDRMPDSREDRGLRQ